MFAELPVGIADPVERLDADPRADGRAQGIEAGGRGRGAHRLTGFAPPMLLAPAPAGEFCNMKRRIAHLLTMYGFVKRRIAHLLTMYGFVLHLVSTIVMVFNAGANSAWAHLWWIGGLMVLVGGYWFWFFIRVDVAAEGSSPFRLMRADLFVLSLLASVTLGLIWAWLLARGSGAAGLCSRST